MADDARNRDQDFKYDAFISYRHVDRDRKWAEWLIEALENFRVPAALQAKGCPPRLRKVFRDEDEVPASADLNDQIREALEASRYLIVVCSAFTPRSKWVVREIEMFNELGRSDQVLALLTEGEPQDAFPDAMLVRIRKVVEPGGGAKIIREDKEPLAADVRPRKGVSTQKLKRFAILRLVAVILGVQFDDLRQRQSEREHLAHVILAGVAVACCLGVAGLGFAYWNMMRPTTNFYRQLVWRWELPEGVGLVDAQSRQHLAVSYSIVTQRSNIFAPPRVVETRRENSAGALIDADASLNDGETRARWVMRYRDDDALERIVGYDARERVLREDVLQTETSPNRMIVAFQRNNIPVVQESNRNVASNPSNTQTGVLDGKSEITRQELVFDDSGFVIERRYQDNWGTPRHDANGSFGERYTVTASGLVLRVAEVGPDGAEITLRNGVRAIVTAYAVDGVPTRYAIMGADDNLIDGPNGYAFYTRERDTWGNGVKTSYFHPDGKSATYKDGYSSFSAAYDGNGFLNGLSYFDAAGQPTSGADGYARLALTEDKNGRATEARYFDSSGKPTVIKGGYASLTRTYDSVGHILVESYFDVGGKPTTHVYGESSVRQTFDSRGNLVEKSYFDGAGKPALVKDEFSILATTFDALDHAVVARYLGVDGQPTLDKIGVAKILSTYDARGNYTHMRGYGIDDKLSLWNVSGLVCAGIDFTYDDRGNLVEIVCIGVDGKPVIGANGAAGFRQKFDDQGNRVEFGMLGTDGKPKVGNDRVATTKTQYDTRGNVVENAFFDVDGNPVLNANGIAGVWQTFDAQSRRADLRYFGLDRGAIASQEGIAAIKYKYDPRGNIAEYAYFDVNGQPTRHKAGFAGILQTFDERNKITAYTTIGLDRAPVVNTNGSAGWRQTYDSYGHILSLSFVDAAGARAMTKEGYSEFRQSFDPRGNVLDKSYFDAHGAAVAIHNGGYQRVAWTYDGRDDLVEEAYFNADGKPAHDSGCVKIEYTYDNLGRETSVGYFDANDQAMQVDIVIVSVVSGQAGDRSGLLAGDRILTYAGQAVSSIRRFDTLVGDAMGNQILTVGRGSQTISLSVPAGALNVNLVLVAKTK